MARRYGKLNRYRSRIRRCALSGLRGYEHQMIHKWGQWYLPRWVDKEVHGRSGRVIGGGGRAGDGGGATIVDPWTHGQHTPSATPSSTPSATVSATVSATASSTMSPSATVSATVSSTMSPSATVSPSATSSATPSCAWTLAAPYPSAISGYIMELISYDGKLYACTGDDGILWEWNGVDAFANKAPAYFGAGYGVSNFMVWRGSGGSDSPGALLCLAFGTSPYGGNLLEWHTGASAFALWCPQVGTYHESWPEPYPVSYCSLQPYWTESSWIVVMVGLTGRTYTPMYMGEGGAYWAVKAERVLDYNGATTSKSNGDVYIGTRARFGLYGGKCRTFTGTGYYDEAAKYESETYIWKMLVYNSVVYARTWNGYVLTLNEGSHAWGLHTSTSDDNILYWCVHGSYLYALTTNGRLVYSNGGSWVDTQIGSPDLCYPNEEFVKCLYSYNGKLYAGGAQGLWELEI